MGLVDTDPRVLLGARTAMSRLDVETRRAVATATRSRLAPAWSRLIAYRVAGSQMSATIGRGQVLFSPGGKGSLRVNPARGMTGVRRHDLGKPARFWIELVDYGPRSGDGRLPARVPAGRVTRPAAAAFAGYAAQVWLRVLADALRSASGGR